MEEMIELVLDRIGLFFMAMRLTREIKGSSLAGLKSIAEEISYAVAFHGSLNKRVQVLQDVFVNKVMLLVTCEEDVVAVIRRLEDTPTRLKLIQAYGCKSRSLSTIVKLLPLLAVGKKEDNAVASMLIARANELIAAENQRPTGATAIANICSLAERVTDPNITKLPNDGSAAKTQEDIVIALAIPQIKGNIDLLEQVAESFDTMTGRHRLLLAYLEEYGFRSRYKVKRILQLVQSKNFHGADVAKKILAMERHHRVGLGGAILLQLLRLADDEKRFKATPRGIESMFAGLPNTDLLRGLSSLFDNVFGGPAEQYDFSKCSTCAGLAFCPNEEAKAYRAHQKLSSSPRDPFLDLFGDSGILGINLGSMLAGNPGQILGIVREVVHIGGENALQKLEEKLLEAAREGILEGTSINGMTVAEFLRTPQGQTISPEVRAEVEEALLRD